MADLGPAILSAASGLAGALIGGLVTLTVQRRSLDLQQRSIEVQRGTLELQQAQTARAAERRWDDTRRSVYSEYLALVARFRRELIAVLDDHLDGRPAEPAALRARLREIRSQTSASYNTLRLISSAALEVEAKQLLIDVTWYLDRLAEMIDRSGTPPPAADVEAIRDKYEKDAPSFVRQAQLDLGIRTERDG